MDVCVCVCVYDVYKFIECLTGWIKLQYKITNQLYK